MRMFELSARLSDGEIVTRELKATSESSAIRMMELKFAGATDITLLGTREQTEAEKDEEQTLRSSDPARDEGDKRASALGRRNRGMILTAVGLVGTLLTFRHEWLIYLFLVVALYGFYDYKIGTIERKRSAEAQAATRSDRRR